MSSPSSCEHVEDSEPERFLLSDENDGEVYATMARKTRQSPDLSPGLAAVDATVSAPASASHSHSNGARWASVNPLLATQDLSTSAQSSRPSLKAHAETRAETSSTSRPHIQGTGHKPLASQFSSAADLLRSQPVPKERASSLSPIYAPAVSDSPGSGNDDELQAPHLMRKGLKKFMFHQSSTGSPKRKAAKSSAQSTSTANKKSGQKRRDASAESQRAESSTRNATNDTDNQAAPGLSLPLRERARLLDQCPLCKSAWTANKAVTAKLTHIEKCANTNQVDTQTLAVLTEDRIIELACIAERSRRQAESSQSLFDRAIGTGEGVNAMREVTVVGIELDVDMLGAHKAQMDEWQTRLDRMRKRPPVNQVTAVAKQILRDRSSNTVARGVDESGSLATSFAPMPSSTAAVVGWGKQFKRDSDVGTEQRLAAILMGDASAPSFAHTRRARAAMDDGNDVLIVDDALDALPSTQQLAPSIVAKRFNSVLCSRSDGTRATAVCESGVTRSLWSAAAHSDVDHMSPLRPVNSGASPSSPASFPSFPSSPSSSAPSTSMSNADGHTVQMRSLVSPVNKPAWESMTVKQLQDEVARYGFRRARTKMVLVQQLRDVWHAMHGASPSAGRHPSVDEGSIAANVMPAKNDPQLELGTVTHTADLPELYARLRRAIRAEDDLYHRILRYEPVHIDDIVAPLMRRGFKLSRPKLVEFLDRECITFYTQDPTNGTRSRYK
ncbi:hypothetical protein OIO90_002021 [Microbotryomycetes sp. JL221]|nr:hypothetical protein OIO90_002021 [Microbotryomycetes sp. JL221]